MRKLYEENSIQNIAKAIRQELGTDDLMTVNEMPYYINKINSSFGIDLDLEDNNLDENGNWVRPEEYEDLSQLTIGDEEEICYLSLYKNTSTPWKLCLYIVASRGSQIEYGHIADGGFVPIGSPETIDSGKVYCKDLPEEETSLVAKIVSKEKSYPITQFFFYQMTTAQSNRAISTPYYLQPVVERIGRLPKLTNLANSGATRGCGTAYLERDALRFGEDAKVTTLSGMYQYCYNLQEIDLNDINTTNWAVTSLSYMFYHCAKIKKIDLSKWNTANWPVNNIVYIFGYCISLNDLKINTWNTKKWEIALLNYCFLNNVSLKELDINNWDTSNWKITSLRQCFENCISLQTLDLSNWNTSNWIVDNLEKTFSYCQSLKTLNINTWDTSNWPLTSLYYTFDQCSSLTTLDLNDWDTTNWSITRLNSTFQRMNNVKALLIDKWDTSNWSVAEMSYMFAYDYCLQKLPVEDWDTSNWPLSNITYFCQYCYSLKKLDLSKWDSSKFVLTNCRASASYCHNLTYLNVSSLQSKSGTSADLFFGSQSILFKLVDYYPQLNLNCDQQYNSFAINLSKESLLRILNALPIASGTRKLTLGNLRAKLTAEEIAIATQKGWTVA